MRLLMLRTVLVATDLTPASEVALDTARRLSEASGAKLRVVHVHAAGVPPPDADDLARRAGLTPGKRQVDILSGDPAAEISDLANRIGADLIVLGHHRDASRHSGDAPVGSTAYHVITKSEAPCLVVSRPLDLPLRRALVATDFSDAARGALLSALSWTSALRSRAPAHPEPRLVALHVESGQLGAGRASDSDELNRELEALKRHAGEWSGVQVHGRTRSGPDPASCIVESAREDGVELVVMGTHARKDAAHTALGSIADAVIRAQDIPVLLVPPAVWRAYARELDAA